MNFERLLDLVRDEPVFDASLLIAGPHGPAAVRQQLSRWCRAGRVQQLRRGVYVLAPRYRTIEPHPYLVANRLVRPSYVSLHAALAHHGLIPEYVTRVTSVTTARTGRFATPVGRFDFRHVQAKLFRDYARVDLGRGQSAFVARPHKALVDLIYLQPGADSRAWVEGLRLQNLDCLDLEQLRRLTEELGSPKLLRAVAHVARRFEDEAEYSTV